MLIAHLFDTFPNPEDFNETAIGDLQVRKYMKPNFILTIYSDLDVQSYIVLLTLLILTGHFVSSFDVYAF